MEHAEISQREALVMMRSVHLFANSSKSITPSERRTIIALADLTIGAHTLYDFISMDQLQAATGISVPKNQRLAFAGLLRKGLAISIRNGQSIGIKGISSRIYRSKDLEPSNKYNRTIQISQEKPFKMIGHHTQEQWLERIKFFGWKCRYCGTPLTIETATKDHVIPRSRGGSDWPSNLVPACRLCNSKKSNKPLQQFLAHWKTA